MRFEASGWGRRLKAAASLRGAAAVLLAIGSFVVASPPIAAQPIGNFTPAAAVGGEQMLLEAGQLVYDYDHDTVSAVGNVRVYYKGYVLESGRLTYNRRTARLLASENVKITEPNGSVIRSQAVDVTDDFRDGFVDSLRVETPQRTRFAAESAQRVAEGTTVFQRGVYTACEPCKQHPEKPPLWQVKAGKIVHDNVEHSVTFHNATFEFAGVPVAWMPVFWAADPTVKRKSGFLIPRQIYTEPLGYGVRVPYFWAPAPNYDLTFSPEYVTRQGFLMDLQWRHRLENGAYTIDAAGIKQRDGSAFVTPSSRVSPDLEWRGGVRTTGDFKLSPLWNFGWDATLSSDRTFTRYYGVLTPDNAISPSNVHLTGISDRNYFDARAYYFHVLTDNTQRTYDQGLQPVVHPVIDHSYIAPQSVFGGELKIKSNLTSLSRSMSDAVVDDDLTNGGIPVAFLGVRGSFTRLSSEVSWQRQIVGPAGQVLIPFTYIRGDAFFLNANDPLAYDAGLTRASEATRGMAALGLEWRWPWLFGTDWGTHVLEPIAQIIVRPDEQLAGQLPNEDAQSLVFDDTNIFERDKFSGWDRVEGGTRINAGLHYVGNVGAVTLDGLVGESFNVAGTNSFASPDLAGTGAFSGLQTERSDIVSRLKMQGPTGASITARARIDQGDFSLNRGELQAAAPFGPVSAATSLVYVRNTSVTPTTKSYGARASASARLFDNWRVFGAVTYDITNQAIAGSSLGLAYDDDCLSLSVAYSETRNQYTDLVSAKEVWLRLQLRTLGEGTLTQDVMPQP